MDSGKHFENQKQQQERDAISPDVENMFPVKHQLLTGETAMRINHLEDVTAEDRPIDAEAILTDEQLERGGLVKVEAFMRTRTSAAAARKARQREREESEGLRQINIKADEETGAALKSIAAEIGRGATLLDAIVKAVPSVTSPALVTPPMEIKADPETERLTMIGRKVDALTGWRRLVAKLFGVL